MSAFAFAGIWDNWNGNDHNPFFSYTIITTKAAEPIHYIHHRMPVILPRAVQTQWLDPSVSKTKQIQELLMTGDTDLSVYPVSTFVNSPANNSVSCTVPYADRSVVS